MTDWEAALYDKTYNDELNGIEKLVLQTKCTRDDLENTLKSLYITEGADWAGRGEVQDITLRATIAAYETAVHRAPSGAERRL